jgi:predicted GNAT family acetyltransferase
MSHYRHRVSELIGRGETFVRWAPGPERKGYFKADLGAIAADAVQLHGVWVAPEVRGRGFGTAGMSAVVAACLARGFTSVSLYVNDYNLPALAVYRKLGFREVGTWATVLL